MGKVEYPDTIQLIQNSFTTILLDAIQFYPQESKMHKAESHGLLFGNINGDILECDYIFPVGNVTYRKVDEIKNNPQIDKAIQNAKHLLFTSRCFGTYHSHPNTSSFEDWAKPSNMDVLYAKNLEFPYILIIAISRNSIFEKSMSIEYLHSDRKEYYYEKRLEGHGSPTEKIIEGESTYIQGGFKKYKFELRAYKYEQKCLKDINLISSEVDMLMELIKNSISIDALESETTYALRKIEYDFRILSTQNDKLNEKAKQNLQYHLQKIK